MKKNPDFSRLSKLYDLLGLLVFQGSLHKSQIYFLEKLPEAENVLILGGGTGKFLADLVKSGKAKKITYVDISPGMIARAEAKVEKLNACVEFICGGADSIPAGRYDLICTHYFLDCFDETELKELSGLLKSHLTENGVWHFTDFYLDEKASFFRTGLLSFLYFFFRLTCGLKVKELADFRKIFSEAGLKLKEEEFFRKGLLRTALYTN